MTTESPYVFFGTTQLSSAQVVNTDLADELYGKYAREGVSLTEALLRERANESDG